MSKSSSQRVLLTLATILVLSNLVGSPDAYAARTLQSDVSVNIDKLSASISHVNLFKVSSTIAFTIEGSDVMRNVGSLCIISQSASMQQEFSIDEFEDALSVVDGIAINKDMTFDVMPSDAINRSEANFTKFMQMKRGVTKVLALATHLCASSMA